MPSGSVKKKNGRRTRIPAPSLAAPLVIPALNSSLPTSSSTVKKQEPPVLHVGAEPQPSGMIDQGLPIPDRYGFDRLVALPRDPRTIFNYWELDGRRLLDVRQARGDNFVDSCAWVLRLYRLNEGVAIDMEIDPSIGNWYIDVGGPGRYQTELALLSPDGEWITLLVSQVVSTPALGPSDIIDDEWRMRPEDEELAEYLRRLAAEIAAESAANRGNSGFLGASRVAASFGVVSSLAFPGSSFSGRPVAGSWGWSFIGASGRVSGSGSGSGGFGWIVAPNGAHEPVLERPTVGSGPNWNAQDNLPQGPVSKTQQPHFKVKLPRRVTGVIPGAPTWPSALEPARSGRLNLAASKKTKSRKALQS
jgi:hypothetical protein